VSVSVFVFVHVRVFVSMSVSMPVSVPVSMHTYQHRCPFRDSHVVLSAQPKKNCQCRVFQTYPCIFLRFILSAKKTKKSAQQLVTESK